MRKYITILLLLIGSTFLNALSKLSLTDIEPVDTEEKKLLKIRYYNNLTEEDHEATESMEDAIHFFNKLASTPDFYSFLTVTFSEVQSIQFAWQNGKWLVEITNTDKERVFRQRYATPEECVKMIETAYTGDPNKLDGFVDVPIMTKTLDEVLEEQDNNH